LLAKGLNGASAHRKTPQDRENEAVLALTDALDLKHATHFFPDHRERRAWEGVAGSRSRDWFAVNDDSIAARRQRPGEITAGTRVKALALNMS
jgi:hypothetical protein